MFGCVAALNGVCAARVLVVQKIKPSEADPRISRFNDANYVVRDEESTAQQELVVFFPGTRGKPERSAQLLRIVASQGYRVIGLTYNDVPAIVQVCPYDPSPSCSAAVRERRVFGIDATNAVENTPAESIVQRLVRLLEYLDQNDPRRQWRSYLSGEEPEWNRIVVSGLSQGAGMAAYIAKHRSVARVVLFSSPWDYQRQRSRVLAPWLFELSATPPERWFAAYHRRENTAALLAKAYAALRIPTDHIRVFDLDLPMGMNAENENPYHGSTIKNLGYINDWKFLFGQSP